MTECCKAALAVSRLNLILVVFEPEPARGPPSTSPSSLERFTSFDTNPTLSTKRTKNRDCAFSSVVQFDRQIK